MQLGEQLVGLGPPSGQQQGLGDVGSRVGHRAVAGVDGGLLGGDRLLPAFRRAVGPVDLLPDLVGLDLVGGARMGQYRLPFFDRVDVWVPGSGRRGVDQPLAGVGDRLYGTL